MMYDYCDEEQKSFLIVLRDCQKSTRMMGEFMFLIKKTGFRCITAETCLGIHCLEFRICTLTASAEKLNYPRCLHRSRRD